jgi:hypothetical protein
MSVKRKGPSLRSFASKLQALPRVTAVKVAELGADKISTAAQTSFDGGQTAFGAPRPLGSRGNTVTLVKGGKLRSAALQFRHDGGTRIRAALLDRYMGVMNGRFGVLPGGGDPLPREWQRALSETAREVVFEETGSSA